MGKNEDIHEAAITGDVNRIHSILNIQPAAVNAKGSMERTPLMWAARWERVETLEYLLQRGANLNETDVGKRTALHWAAQYGRAKAVETLVKNGANINAQDANLWTPIHYAAFFSYAEIVKLLLDCGADVLAVDTEGLTPRELLSTKKKGSASPVIMDMLDKAQYAALARCQGGFPQSAALGLEVQPSASPLPLPQQAVQVAAPAPLYSDFNKELEALRQSEKHYQPSPYHQSYDTPSSSTQSTPQWGGFPSPLPVSHDTPLNSPLIQSHGQPTYVMAAGGGGSSGAGNKEQMEVTTESGAVPPCQPWPCAPLPPPPPYQQYQFFPQQPTVIPPLPDPGVFSMLFEEEDDPFGDDASVSWNVLDDSDNNNRNQGGAGFVPQQQQLNPIFFGGR